MRAVGYVVCLFGRNEHKVRHHHDGAEDVRASVQEHNRIHSKESDSLTILYYTTPHHTTPHTTPHLRLDQAVDIPDRFSPLSLGHHQPPPIAAGLSGCGHARTVVL